MKNRIKYNIRLAVLSFAAALTFAACSDWIEMEGVNIKQQNPAEENPELQARYLENLRNYKQRDHKFVYAWFDNSEKTPFSRGQHLDAVPDSIDVISLIYPDKLADFEIKEIESIRQNKGTKVVYSISFETISKTYDELVKAATEKDPEYKAEDFISYLGREVSNALKPADTYNYDGIIMKYLGKSTLHMTSSELEAYTAQQEKFLGLISNWLDSHKGKMLVFEGCPQNLLNKDILKSCKHIILNTADVATVSALSLEALQASVTGVPTDRFIVAARTTDSSDKKIGYYDTTKRAVTEAATWVTSSVTSYTKAGLGIYNIQNDYYNPNLVYQYVKEAINIMNPAPKN